MGDSTQKTEVEMKTKVIMSITVRPDLKAKLVRATREDGDKISPVVEGLIENYLEVRAESRSQLINSGPDPMGLRA